MTELIVALDCTEPKAILLANSLNPKKCILKVGLELYTSAPHIIDTLIDEDFKIFLDLKLHDIPNTIAAAVRNISDMGVWGTTIHLLGYENMLKAAFEAKVENDLNLKLFGVTVLTSMKPVMPFKFIGSDLDADEIVPELAAMAEDAFFDGVVCSVHEVHKVKEEGPDLLTICPGIRLLKQSADDQERVATPIWARDAGADYVVVGRSITNAKNPAAAADEIYNTLNK